jgi:predicted Zn-dependent peptidase
MLNGTGLDDLCIIANDPASLKNELQRLFNSVFTGEEISRREKILTELYSNTSNADKLVKLVWGMGYEV